MLYIISMKSLCSRLGKCFYSNIKLSYEHERKAAFLTLSNEKKRNPLALATIQELYSAISDVEAKVASDKLKVAI